MILSVSGRKKVPNSCMSEEEKEEKKRKKYSAKTLYFRDLFYTILNTT